MLPCSCWQLGDTPVSAHPCVCILWVLLLVPCEQDVPPAVRVGIGSLLCHDYFSLSGLPFPALQWRKQPDFILFLPKAC